MIDLAVISRERPEKCRKMIDSFLNTATHRACITIVIGVDDDDPTRADYEKLAKDYSPSVRICPLPEGGNVPNMGMMWKTVIYSCQSPVIGYFGDDVRCVTQGWDEIVMKHMVTAIPAHKMRMLYGNDCIHDVALATWAFLRKEYIDAVGLKGWTLLCVDWIDVYLHKIFVNNNALVYEPALTIRHEHPIKGYEVDNLFMRNRQKCHLDRARFGWDACQGQLADDVRGWGKSLTMKNNSIIWKTPYQELIYNELAQYIDGLISRFNYSDRLLIELRFFKDLKFKMIKRKYRTFRKMSELRICTRYYELLNVLYMILTNEELAKEYID